MGSKRLHHDDVLRVRAEFDRNVPHSAIARRYGISMSTVGSIGRRLTYAKLREANKQRINDLFRNYATAGQYEHFRKVQASLSEIEFQLRQATLPDSWSDIAEEIEASHKELQRSVSKLFRKFDRAIPKEKRDANHHVPKEEQPVAQRLADITGVDVTKLDPNNFSTGDY